MTPDKKSKIKIMIIYSKHKPDDVTYTCVFIAVLLSEIVGKMALSALAMHQWLSKEVIDLLKMKGLPSE